MVNDRVAPQPRSDAAANTPNWDADLFRGSSSTTSSPDSSSRPTDSLEQGGGGKLLPNDGGGKLAEFPGTAPAVPESESENGTGGGGKLNPFAGPSEAPFLSRISSNEESEVGGKLNPNAGSSEVESLVALVSDDTDFEAGGKLNPNGGSTEIAGGGKLNPNGGSEDTEPGGGKLKPYGGMYSATVAALIDGGPARFQETGDSGGKLNPNGGSDRPHDRITAVPSFESTNPNAPHDGGSSPSHDASLASASDAVQSGDFDALKKSLEKAFEENGVDAKKFNNFGKKLAEKMKGKGFNVNSGDGVLTVHREGDPHGVEFKMDGHLDFSTGRIRGEAQAQSYDFATKQNVDRRPEDVLTARSSDDPRRSQTDALAQTDNNNVRDMNAHRMDNRLNRLMRPAPAQRRHLS